MITLLWGIPFRKANQNTDKFECTKWAITKKYKLKSNRIGEMPTSKIQY